MPISSRLRRYSGVAAAVATALHGPYALAQEPVREIEEIIVTATKRQESLQDVPVAVTALDASALEELGVTNFSDYVMQLPGVTAGGTGPGQNTVYIRGVASTTPNLTTAGVAGLAPNVAFYLDDQPLAQPGRNLDVYAADLARVEVLAGPQGTLFGASSQAGNVRLITNKPDLEEFYGNIKAGVGTITDGDMNSNLEFMLNIPVTQNFALRGVFYTDTKGGYIDNVAGTRTAAEGGRFRAAGTVRANGVPVSAQREGFQAGADLSGVTFLASDNASLVEEDFNEATYTGGRLSGKWEINEQWSLLVSHTQQELEADGVFFADPGLGDLEVQRYSRDTMTDEFSNTAWTLQGFIGELEVVYAGAYTDRETDQNIDYSDYLFIGQYLPYYICDASVTYPGAGNNPSGTCQAPNLFVNSATTTEVITHELRFSTNPAQALRVTAGAFYSDLELTELNDFTYPGSVNVIGFDGVSTGFAPNFPLTNIAVTGMVGNAAPGYFSDAGPFPADVIFRNDILRTDEQFGVFGELTYDFNESFAVIVGARYYDISVDLEGSANSSFGNLGSTTDAQGFGTNISAQFAPGNSVGAPDSADTDGVIVKTTLQWRPTDDQMYYFTYSEGFRPGLLNRPGGAAGPNGFTVPFELDTDDVRNYELGIKSSFLDNTLRFNG
ncbi:MAG: TonB-dependent receptor, partial [Pseudomonadota bacterium]